MSAPVLDPPRDPWTSLDEATPDYRQCADMQRSASAWLNDSGGFGGDLDTAIDLDRASRPGSVDGERSQAWRSEREWNTPDWVSRDWVSKIEKLKSSLMVPFEDCVYHRSESILEGDLKKEPEFMLAVMRLFDDSFPNVELLSSLTRCIGRMDHDLITPWGEFLAARSLSHPDPEVREAGVRAFEMWESPEFIPALEAALENETIEWLATYIGGVISDLREGADA